MVRNRKGFSIIEVLIAVLITSIAAMALMETAAQGRRAYETAIKHRETAESLGLIALSSTAMGGNGRSNAATILSSRYQIDNSRIIERLKIQQYVLKTEYSHRWSDSNESNDTKRAVASISANAIEQTFIEVNGVKSTLYGLSGEGW
ncbi:MAG: prepilin-type N-terminal cleavage/methylation domain-containing protein [Sulfuricurvum sp.]|nr:prepilin-type N-terminal cleavage/methylation domain-containing protein [Sulfuricurvum sp.]